MSERRRQLRPRDPRTGKLYRIISSSPKLSAPPKAVRRAKLDNLALVPASLLPFKEQYQELANSLPAGAVLIVLPGREGPQKQALEAVVDDLKLKGHQVTTLAAKSFS